MTETLAGALIGAAGGLFFGALFGLLCWAPSGAAQVVLTSGWSGMWAAGLAGGVASFSNMWFGWEPIGWKELVAHRRTTGEESAKGPPLSAFAQGGGLIIRSSGEVMRASSSTAKWATNGQPSTRPPGKAP